MEGIRTDIQTELYNNRHPPSHEYMIHSLTRRMDEDPRDSKNLKKKFRSLH